MVLLMWSWIASAQMASFKHYGLDKSIFPSRIECIDQTDHGELLIGTLAGLVIYDGFEFTTHSVRSGLAESSISSLSALGSHVFIGHWAGNVSIYDMKTDTFDVWKTAPTLGFASVVQILPLSVDSALAVTSDGRLYSISEDVSERIVLGEDGESVRVNQVLRVKDGFIVIADDRIVKKQGSASTNLLRAKPGQRFNYACTEGDQWIVADNDGLELMEKTTRGEFSVVKEIDLGREVLALQQDRQGHVWAMTEEDGVSRYHLQSQQLRHFRRENGLSYNQIRALFCDREGTIWIATAAGLDQFLGDAFVLIDDRQGLEGSMVWDVELVSNQFFVLTSYGLAIGELTADAARLEVRRFVELIDLSPRQLEHDGGNRIWIRTQQGKVFRYDLDVEKLIEITDVEVPVNCVEVVDGEVWFGTDEGIFRRGSSEGWSRLTSGSGLAGDKVTGIYYSKERNETWITVLGAPVTLYHDGKFRQFGTAEGISSSVIQDAAFDRDGLVWFATYDKGVFRFQEEGSFVSLTEEVALTSTTTFAIEMDRSGKVWIGHNWGVDSYDPATKQLTWFGEDKGFMGVEVNAGAMHFGSDDALWMGTLMGLLHFEPNAVRDNAIEPSLKLESARLGSKDLLKPAAGLRFLSAENDFALTFSSISLANPERNEYRYRLRGVHENWRSIDRPGKIEFLSLPAGDFTFELIACNDSELCSSQPYTLSFSIYPPFYRTWWFYTILFVLVVVTIFFMDRYRVVNLLEQKHQVEEQLALQQQYMVDLDQERERLEQRLKSDTDIIRTLEEGDRKQALKTCELLPNFRIHQRLLETVSSDGVLCFQNTRYNAVFMVDVGVQGNAAHPLRAQLLHKMKAVLPAEFDAVAIITTWTQIVRDLEDSFGKFKGVQWTAFLSSGESSFLGVKGMSVFTIPADGVKEAAEDAETERIEGTTLWPFRDDGTVVVCSDGIFAQLNEAGTRSYPKQRLMKLLEEKRNASQDQIVAAVWSDLSDWSGAMEQFDDISLFIWNHA